MNSMFFSFSNLLQKINSLIPPVLYAPVVIVLWLVVLWLAKRLVFYRLRKWALSTTRRWDDIIIKSISFPIDFLIIASSLTILINLLPLPDKAEKLATMALQGSIIFSIVLFLDGLTKGIIDEYAAKSAFTQASHGLTKGIIRGLIIGLGVLIFLDLIGISITPILASLGIGSLAVALALQDTLSNFFAGIYVAIDKPVDVGDFVRLETGQEGYVIDIGWRSTRIRTMVNNVIVVPNAKIIGSIITNYFLPEKELAVLVEVGVDYKSDLAKVEKVTLETARNSMKTVKGGVPEFGPTVFFHTFAESSINLTVTLRAKEFADIGPLRHEFIKELHERYQKENINIPYPTRTVEIKKEV